MSLEERMQGLGEDEDFGICSRCRIRFERKQGKPGPKQKFCSKDCNIKYNTEKNDGYRKGWRKRKGE